MIVDQIKLLLLHLNGLLLGVFLGILSDVGRLVRFLFGVSYGEGSDLTMPERTLPHLPPMKKRKTRKINGVLRFVEDFTFCMLGAILVILMFYEGNRGKIRILPIAMVGVGFVVYRKTVGLWVRSLFGWAGFFTLAAIRYSLIPLTWLKKRIFAVLWKYREKIMLKKRIAYTEKQFLRVKIDGCGIIPKRKGEKRIEAKTDQHDTPCAYFSRLVRDRVPLRFCRKHHEIQRGQGRNGKIGNGFGIFGRKAKNTGK